MTYEEFDTLPSYEQAIWGDGGVLNEHAVKWSNQRPPPAIGSEITVTVNPCGPAIVTGYFVQDNWLGLICELTAPPDWFVGKSDGDKKTHVFGAECSVTSNSPTLTAPAM